MSFVVIKALLWLDLRKPDFHAELWIFRYTDFYYLMYRVAVCDVICLKALVLPGGNTMEGLYGNGRKFASLLLTSSTLIIEDLQY